MQQNRAVPAPIFNARKRPRQAVIAEPQMPQMAQMAQMPQMPQMAQMGPGPAGAAPYQGLMPPCGFPNQGQQQRQQQHQQQQQQLQQQQQQQQQHRMSSRGDAGSSYRQNTNSTRPWNTNRTQNRSYGNSTASSNNIQINPAPSRNSGNLGNQHYSQVPRQNNYQDSLPGPRMQNTGAAYGETRTFNFNKQNRLQQPQMPENNHGTRGMPGYGMSAGNSMYGSSGGPTSYPGGKYAATPSTSGQYTPAFANNTGDFDDDLADAMGFVPTQMLNSGTTNTTNTSVNSSSSTVAYSSQNGEKLQAAPAKKSTKAADITKSGHLLTVKASGIKRWAKYRDSMQLIFEVFGYLDSAMGRSQNGTKEFLLRDDVKDSVNCVFYEIDRPLVKMTRGQWYRVVGTYEQKTEHLKCVSVRAMSETEKPLVQTLVDRSSQELARLTRHLREQ